MQTSEMYQPLLANTGFRLVELQPANKLTDHVCGKLIYVDLTNHPPFEALSYVWGTSTEKESIQVDGKTLSVTTSLATALRHLRRPDTPRLIWADGVCINQSNLAEKSNHVTYVAKVYQQCTRDLLWLGKDSKALREAAAAMKSLGSIFDLFEQEREWIDKDWQDSERKAFQKMQEALKELFAHSSVWSRVWIVQELAFAPSILLVAGNATLAWEAVEDFLQPDRYIEKYGIPDAYHGPFSHEWSIRTWAGGAISNPQIMCHQRRVVQVQKHVEGGTNFDVLARFRHTKSTDPRDKIYALAGLMTAPLPVTVDYNLPARSVYIDCTKRLIEQFGSLDILVQSAWLFHGNANRNKDLPSWVIDFEQPGEAPIMFAQRNIYDAGGTSLELPLTVSDEGGIRLSGYKISTLSSISRSQQERCKSSILHRRSWHTLQLMPNHLLHAAMQETGNESLSKLAQEKNDDTERTTDNGIDFNKSFEEYWRTLMVDVARYPMRRLNADELAKLMTVFHQWIRAPLETGPDDSIESIAADKIYDYYSWDFGVTEDRSYCRLPQETELGDLVVVLEGSKVPVVLREIQSPDCNTDAALNTCQTFQFIGPCYAHGFMDGEALKEQSHNKTSFVIV